VSYARRAVADDDFFSCPFPCADEPNELLQRVQGGARMVLAAKCMGLNFMMLFSPHMWLASQR
jgi:hypothetical protein